MELRELIPAMAGLMSITGYECYDAKALAELTAGFDEVRTDAVGNRTLVRRCGREGAPRILIDTHFDEIGMMVSDVLEGGFLRVVPVGGLDLRTLPAAEVKIYGKEVLDGVVASTPPHLQKPGEEKKLVPVDELLIDTGYEKEELSELVRIGTPVGFAPHYQFLENDRLVGKGLDNKACAACAVSAILETPREELAGDVYLVLSVHEETDPIGGTAPGGFAVDPDYAMVVDVNLARTPDTKKRDTIVMGKGPSITRSSAGDRQLTKLVEEAATRAGIPWQVSVAAMNMGTNAPALHLVRHGIPLVDVGVPLRAMHTFVEMLDMADAAQLCAMIRLFITDKNIAEVYHEKGR
ncbi:MAG: M42 family metallopeptidase [Ruminococcaceae bacterium]|nr:M42 family metallopeptidase [Oscillospiraceae bacterium]